MDTHESIPVNRPITSREDFKKQLKWLTVDIENLVRLNVDLVKREVLRDTERYLAMAAVGVVTGVGLLVGLVMLSYGLAWWIVGAADIRPWLQPLLAAVICLLEFAIIGGIAFWRLRAAGKREAKAPTLH